MARAPCFPKPAQLIVLTTTADITTRDLSKALQIRLLPKRKLSDAEKAAEDYGLDTREIAVELGRRKMVGGQEDMIFDVALDMVKARAG